MMSLKYFVAVFLFSVSMVWAGDVEDGDKAFEKKDYVTALKKYKSAAAKNNTYAQLSVGNMYNEGLGVKPDYVEAVHWYKLSASQGYAEAQFNIGYMYSNGQGVVQDIAEAVRWYKLAAAQGYADAQTSMGNSYLRGEGVVQNYAEAVRWYKLGAAQGYPVAQSNLGAMHNEGYGVVKNYVEAVRWYKLAAAQGYVKAQYNLGVMYNKGQGVKQDYAEAVRWLKLAAAQGDENAATLLDAAAEQRRVPDKQNRLQLSKEFPFYAEITCKGIHFSVCFTERQVDTEIELRNGSEYKMYSFIDLLSLKSSGEVLVFNLRNKFSLKMQNASSSFILNLKIYNRSTNEIVFEKSASKFGVIGISN